MNTIIKTIILIICSLILNSCGKKSLEESAPYNTVIHKTVTSVNDAFVITNHQKAFKDDYPKRLVVPTSSPDEYKDRGVKIPSGSTIKLDKVEHYKDPIALISSAYVFGEVIAKDTGKIYKVQYSWGLFRLVCKTDPCHYWEYNKAPWQKEYDSTKYFE